MKRAMWNGAVIAESDATVEVDGNDYFPPESVHMEYLAPSDTRAGCPWKGLACYYHVVVDDETNKNAAWYYPDPSSAAAHIKGYVAFSRGVEVR